MNKLNSYLTQIELISVEYRH